MKGKDLLVADSIAKILRINLRQIFEISINKKKNFLKL